MNSLQLLSPPSTPADSHKKTATTRYLEDLNTRIVNAIDTHDWENPAFDHIAPDFQALMEFSDTPIARGREEYVGVYKKLVAKHPEYRCKIMNTSANVNENKGEATIWTVVQVFPDPNTVREGVTLSNLSRRDGKWWYTRRLGIRGISLTS